MDAAEARRRLAAAEVATLATVGASGAPHAVPICFVVDGDTIYFAIDHKPKRGLDLQRLRNIRANPAVAVLASHYEHEWSRLWWVRADGVATVLDSGDRSEHAVGLLTERYPQYRHQSPPGPVVAIAIRRVTGWSATS